MEKYQPKLRPTKDFQAKYNKVKAKLALLSSSALVSKASVVKNKGLITEAYEWDDEEVSSDDNMMVEVKVLMVLAEDNEAVSKEGAENGEWVKISMRKHVNTEILKENQNLRKELKELTTITETWLNISNKVNQCISEQIPTKKKRILGVDQLIEDPFSSRQKDLVFVKSSADDTKVSIPSVKRPWLSKAEGFILSNHDTARILPAESQRNATDSLVAVTNSLATDYDSPDESSRIPNIDFLHVFGCPVFIHNHKDNLEKFDEKADDGYFLRYSLVSKAFRVFNTRRQQTKETYHVIFDESPGAIKFTKTSINNINIAESERYLPDEYLHPYEPSQRYQINSNEVSFIEPYESPEQVVLETKDSSDHNGQSDDQNDQSAQTDEILNDDQSEHSNHANDENIIDNLPRTEDIHISEHLSSPNDKHIELVNIIGDPGVGMLTRAMAKELSATSAHECLFVYFLSEEPKKVSKALQHHGWVDVILKAIMMFLAFATYMNFIVYQMDVKSAFLDVKTPMVPPKKLRPDLNGKAINETQYRANSKESHLIVVKRIFRYLKGTPSLGLWYPKCSGFDLKGYSDYDCVGCNMDRESTSSACELLGGKLVC
nr:hypothetical protein [Tanacetum cinerariifolium]